MTINDDKLMLLEQLTYLNSSVAAAAGIKANYKRIENEKGKTRIRKETKKSRNREVVCHRYLRDWIYCRDCSNHRNGRCCNSVSCRIGLCCKRRSHGRQ